MSPEPRRPPNMGAGVRLDLERLAARPIPRGTIVGVVETPRGSRNKYKYDAECGLFRLDKILPAGAAFPFDFGFIPGTI